MGHHFLTWFGKGREFVPMGSSEEEYFREGTGEEPSSSLQILLGLPCMGMGTRFFPLAGQIPIISLLGASLQASSQTAPLQAFFPESTSESTVPKLRARGHSLGSTRCPFGTGVFLRGSSRVPGAASPHKRSCLKNSTLLS